LVFLIVIQFFEMSCDLWHRRRYQGHGPKVAEHFELSFAGVFAAGQLPRNVWSAVLRRARCLHRATFALGTHLNQLTPFLRRTAALESTETLQLGRVDKPQAGSP